MEEKIYIKKDKLVIEIPLYSERHNPYMEEYKEKMDNLVGLIYPVKECSEPEIGFAYNIDMSYKGKGDQESVIFFRYYDEKKDFIKLCEKLKIEIREYDKCDYCGDAITGCWEETEKGKKFFSCELKD